MAILPLNLARVSNTLRSNVAVQSLTRTQSDLLTVENQLSTGKAINSPSDDPGKSAIAMQLRKTLETRVSYADNLKAANSQLSEGDSTLGDLGDLLKQAQTIASANVGSDVTADQRKAAGEVVQSLYNQALTLANKQYNGSYLFGGDRATAAPFVETKTGVQFVGSDTLLKNDYDENSTLAFQLDGNAVFGATSSRVKGSTDLTPAVSANTRLVELRGTSAKGIRLGSIQISDGTTAKTIDLTGSDTLGDVINKINGAGVGTVVASIAADGNSLALSSSTATDNISVNEVGGGKTATDLGIFNVNGAGVGVQIDGASVAATITPLTPLSALNNGAGISTAGLKITNGVSSATIDLTGATDVEDLLNRINNSETGVSAEINSTGTGINLLNTTQGAQLSIGENGGTTAADLGIRSFSASTNLTELNGGSGVRTASGNDIEFADSNGTTFQVDVDGKTTVQDVLDAINTASASAGAGLTASFATTGNGITLADTASGPDSPTVKQINFSEAANDLGLTATPASAGVISGKDVNSIAAQGLFSNLTALRDALKNNDQTGITKAAEGLDTDNQRVTTIRGETGARVQELESRQTRLDDQNVATQSLLSSVEDVDYTSAIAKFQSLQTALQANLQTTSKTMNLSLMDFLG